MKVTVSVFGEPYEGEVIGDSYHLPVDAPENQLETVTFIVENLPEGIEWGDTAQVSLILERNEDAIVVPRSIVQNYLGLKTVFVLEDGVKTKRNIEIGIQSSTEVEVIKGLSLDDQLVLR